jgi:hypothetical protein
MSDLAADTMMPRVFISYSHESDAHKQRVHELAQRLKRDGVSVVIDRDLEPGGPNEGWDKWSEQQADHAAIVLPVFTPEYRKCWDGEQLPGMRLGAIHELKVLSQRLYQAGSTVSFCRALYFEDSHKDSIPSLIQGLSRFHAEKDYGLLLAWLQQQGAAPASKPEDQTPAAIVWPARLADYRWPLADRLEPFAAFHDMATQTRPQRILLIEGASNTGKTVLSDELFRFARALSLRAVLLDLKGCPKLDELFDLLALEKSSAEFLPAFHKASGLARKAALLQDLQNLPAPLLLGFDTYQEAAPEIADWLESQLLRRIEQAPGLLAVIAGQTTPPPQHPVWGRHARYCKLEAIREKALWRDYAEQVLGSPAISEDHIEMLLHVSQGDPGKTSSLLHSFAGAKAAG